MLESYPGYEALRTLSGMCLITQSQLLYWSWWVGLWGPRQWHNWKFVCLFVCLKSTKIAVFEKCIENDISELPDDTWSSGIKNIQYSWSSGAKNIRPWSNATSNMVWWAKSYNEDHQPWNFLTTHFGLNTILLHVVSTFLQPIAFEVSFLQSQNSIDCLILYSSFATFCWKETNLIEIVEWDKSH